MAVERSRKKYILSKEEIETDVTIDYCTNLAYVYSCHQPTCRRLLKLAEQHPDEVDIDINNSISVSAYVPYKWIKIAPPKKQTLSDEDRARIGEQLKQAREAAKGASHE